MATCAIAVLQPDGSYFLKIDPSVSDVTACTYVVQSGADVANSILSMSAEDGSLISVGLVSVWAAAWGMKAVINVVKGSSNETV
ncbi:MAG: hypothetical protein HHJ12_11225 [Glaciimonas sp.]|nr:hypothetical protein [Glaciimonas sp.]